MLGELGGNGGRAADPGLVRRQVEHVRHGRVRLVLRERRVPRPLQRVVGDGRDARMHVSPPLAEAGIEHGREHGVRETHDAVLSRDHVSRDGRLEGGSGDAGPLEERLRGGAERRREPERVARAGRQNGDARGEELLESRRDGQRRKWIGVVGEGPRDLEREERVPLRPLVDPEQRLPRERPVKPIAQDAMQGAGAERPDAKPAAPRLLHCKNELGLVGTGVGDPLREEQEHRCLAEPPEREGERPRRREVEPLDVVDRDDERAGLREQLQHVAHRDRQRAVVDGLFGLVLQERHLERPPPRRAQPWQRLVGDTLEEVAQARVREAALRLRGARREHHEATCARRLDGSLPERRLADPRVPLEDEHRRAVVRSLEEPRDGGQLLLPADDLEHHLPRADRDRDGGKRNPVSDGPVADDAARAAESPSAAGPDSIANRASAPLRPAPSGRGRRADAGRGPPQEPRTPCR
jgi:hypothetical protein